MTRLSEQRLAEIQARAEAATPGPWCTDEWEIYQGTEYVAGAEWIGETCRADDSTGARADAAFIAAARTDVPALLAEVARLRGALSEATGYVAELEAERHSTNEALSDAAEALRAKDASVLRRALAKVTELRDRLKAAGDPDRKGVTAAACLISVLADATEAGEEW